MIEEVDGIEPVEKNEEIEPGHNKGCLRASVLLIALILLFSTAVPLIRFLFQKNYENQVRKFPDTVCDQLTISGNTNLECDSSLSIVEFVPRVFPIGASKDFVGSAMNGFSNQEKKAASQPGCQQPVLWTFSIAKSPIGWRTEVEFLFCSNKLVERNILVNGAPLSLPTYGL